MQQLFILEYLADPRHSAKDAAIKAGYSKFHVKENAYHLLQNPEVQGQIERELNKHLRKLQVNAEMVISGIVNSIERAERAGDGAWQFQAVQRGYELLGKYLGLFTEKVEIGLDEKIMEQLAVGRARAAGLLKEPDADVIQAPAGSEVESDEPGPGGAPPDSGPAIN